VLPAFANASPIARHAASNSGTCLLWLRPGLDKRLRAAALSLRPVLVAARFAGLPESGTIRLQSSPGLRTSCCGIAPARILVPGLFLLVAKMHQRVRNAIAGLSIRHVGVDCFCTYPPPH
jgi:hypothetical protein